MPWGLSDSASPPRMPPLPPTNIPLMLGGSLPALSGSAPPLTQKPRQGGLGASVLEALSCSASRTIAGSGLAQQRHCPFCRPPIPAHCCCTRPEGMLAALWVGTGAPEPAGKIGAPSPSPSQGCQKLQADICPDFRAASTPSEICFPACGGSSRSALLEYLSALNEKPTA